FRADEVEATAPLVNLLGGAPLTLQRVHVVAPRLVLAQAPALTLAGLGGAGFAAAPVVVDGIVVSNGAVVVEEPGRRALVARDLTARLARGGVGTASARARRRPLRRAAERAARGHGHRARRRPLGSCHWLGKDLATRAATATIDARAQHARRADRPRGLARRARRHATT